MPAPARCGARGMLGSASVGVRWSRSACTAASSPSPDTPDDGPVHGVSPPSSGVAAALTATAGVVASAAAAVGAAYAGVDLLPARDGTTYVLEVNGIPGWQGLQAATGVDVAGALIEYLERGRPEIASPS
jgi:hypothetical protein